MQRLFIKCSATLGWKHEEFSVKEYWEGCPLALCHQKSLAAGHYPWDKVWPHLPFPVWTLFAAWSQMFSPTRLYSCFSLTSSSERSCGKSSSLCFSPSTWNWFGREQCFLRTLYPALPAVSGSRSGLPGVSAFVLGWPGWRPQHCCAQGVVGWSSLQTSLVYLLLFKLTAYTIYTHLHSWFYKIHCSTA